MKIESNTNSNIIEEVRHATDIVSVIEDSGVNLKSEGKLFKGLCPFHQEKTPSFTVYPDTESFYCFGCARGGDVFDFIMWRKNITFIEAVRELASGAGIKLPTWTPAYEKEQKETRLKEEILKIIVRDRCAPQLLEISFCKIQWNLKMDVNQ